MKKCNREAKGRVAACGGSYGRYAKIYLYESLPSFFDQSEITYPETEDKKYSEKQNFFTYIVIVLLS